MRKDITTKEIVQSITKDIAFYILNLKVENISFIDKELKRIEKREADIVAKCSIDGKEAILHIEIQNNNDKTMRYRMLRYWVDIKQLFPHLTIYQYLIYIGKDKLTIKNSLDEQNINYLYTLINMQDIDCKKLIELDTPESLVLAILCDFKDKKANDIILHILQRLSELVEDKNKFDKYMLILETLSENRNLKQNIKECEIMLKDIKIENLPSYEIGLERGIEKGKYAGKFEEKRAIARSMLLNNLPIETIIKVTNLSKEDIEKLNSSELS